MIVLFPSCMLLVLLTSGLLKSPLKKKKKAVLKHLVEIGVVKNPPANAGDAGSIIPGLGRFPRGGNGNPFQYSCLENPHGQRSLVGYSPCAHKELNTTEQLSTAHSTTESTFQKIICSDCFFPN